MKRKQLSLILAATLSAACSMSTIAADSDNIIENLVVESVDTGVDASEDAADIASIDEAPESEAAEEAETEAAEAAETEAADVEEEAESESETEGDFVEGSAVLSDYDYKHGELTEEGWSNEFLNMIYMPGRNISMGTAENDQLASYYERNGEDKQVAANEMVAVDDKEGYVQLMVEVNPNHEDAEDILGRFSENEKLTLASDQSEMEIAGKTFLTCTGVVDKDRFLLGVCTDEDDFVIAVKVKYANTVARRALLDGFDVAEEIEAAETEAETEVKTDEEAEEAATESILEEAAESETEEGLIMPAEFEDGEIFEADETEISAVE